LEQYGRRENLEIHGVPVSSGDNTNQIVHKVAKIMDVRLSESQISTSHRLLVSQKVKNKSPVRKGNDYLQHPSIIVQFSNRDKRNELLAKRKMLSSATTDLKSAFGVSTIITIRENLTPKRNVLYNAANVVKKQQNFQFLWTSQGRICFRKDLKSKIIIVSSFSDLHKFGYRPSATVK